jgi:hypothetical protein
MITLKGERHYEHDRKPTTLDHIKNTIYKIKSNFYGDIKNEHIKRSKITVQCLNMLNYIVYIQSTIKIKTYKVSDTYQNYRNQMIDSLCDQAQNSPSQIYDSIDKNADLLTSYLCELLNNLNKQQIDKIIKNHKGINLWWDNHKKQDKKRSIKK